MVKHRETSTTARTCGETATDASALPLRPRRPHFLVAAELLEEIELLLDVIVAVAGYPTHLTSEQLDAVLQVPPRGAQGASAEEGVQSSDAAPPADGGMPRGSDPMGLRFARRPSVDRTATRGWRPCVGRR